MKKELPQIEDSSLTVYLPAKEYQTFSNEEEFRKKCTEWGLLSEKAKEVKEEFWYKGKTYKRKVKIVGYEDNACVVIEFEDGNTTNIHPAYLKEMQTSAFNIDTKEEVVDDEAETETVENTQKKESKKVTKSETAKKVVPKAEKPKKIELPVEKVSLLANVKEFATKYNSFTEENDEVILYQNVRVVNGDEVILELGDAWSSYSASLKKLNLEAGDSLSFDAKLADKKFSKEVPYKINNPSKVTKVAQ